MDPDDLPVQDSDQLPQDTLADELGESDYDRRRLRAQQRARRMGRAVRSDRDMPSDPTEAAEQQEQLHETARAIVLRQLTASAKSRQQLEDKLADKDIPESVARAVLDLSLIHI